MSCLLQLTPHFFLIPQAERKMKALNPVTAGRQGPCLFQGLPAATQQVKDVSFTTPLQHFCLLSVLTASRCCFLPHSPSSVLKISFHLLFANVFQRNWNKIYNCLNFEIKVCRNSRIIENTVFQFGKMALQLFSFFLFLQIFAYCHEATKFMVLIWNASLLAEKQLDFLAIIYNAFFFLPIRCKF